MEKLVIKPSSELLAVSRRWYAHNSNGDQIALPNFMSNSENLRFLGSASGENWCGQEVRDAVVAYFQDKPDILHMEELFAEAFEAGNIGWATIINKVTLAGRSEKPFEFRETLVFALEQGSWKIVSRHGSVPTPNRVILGRSERRWLC
ncbi:nuclear transport factor 2 family protein [Marimonas sp. MJW-29]|uniref:Nuclear transport factor 2 family protein n=1 Tax=Sulfitobacter sediminis TaxID=3234186 RepID=A0ABV3RSP0_9RHOB